MLEKPLGIREKIPAVDAQADCLEIAWPGHGAACTGSFYSWDWLDRHRCETAARLARKKRRTAWTTARPDIRESVP